LTYSIEVDRLDGERLVLDGLGLARAFFQRDPSSIAQGSYDSLAGQGHRDMITTADLEAINRTMRARSSHSSWEPVLNRHLDWLASLDPELDLIEADEPAWHAADAELLVRTALSATIGPYRGPSVATKVLHLKRPRLFPVLDDLVAVMLGVNMPTDASATRRVEVAMELLLHLREQGRRNIAALQAIQGSLSNDGIDRPLLRVFDAMLWFSHPAAGIRGATRELRIGVS
jgi:uncharacterized protein DUF6308